MKRIIDHLFSRILRRKKTNPCPQLSGFRVDLATYRCGGMTIGAPLPADNVFFPDASCEATITDAKQGFEIGAADGALDYVFLDLTLFPGIITRNETPLPYLRFWDERRVTSELGQPYWRDEDGDEVLLFYEDGQIELQIEFPEKSTPRFITLMRNPILSDATQRNAYHCDKPWPPR